MASRALQVRCLLGNLVPYARGLELQEGLAEAVSRGLMPDQLLLLEHAPVYTVGKRGSAADFKLEPQALARLGAQVHTSPRGGETTFHGPGQLVAYPIVNLRARRLGVRAYVEGLEDTLIETLARFNVHARGRVPGATGVYVNERKIAAIGVRVSQGVASHGIALNVCTDLTWFSHIVPCGAPDRQPTSLALEAPKQDEELTPVTTAPDFIDAFARHFGYANVQELEPELH